MSENLYGRLQVLEADDRPLDRVGRIRAVREPLLAWYRQNARVLPWREEPDPYRVWISEIMLQQTRVEAVKPYFARFMEELPDVEALAEVSDDRLLKLWEGLGYYSRARNLKKAARIIVERYGGRLPDTMEELLGLPGIGSYTAGAIASIAYGKPEPAVDGNVLRVLSRLLASRDDIANPAVKRRFEEELRLVIPAENCGAFNQGLIEIGAVVCVPNGEPRCGECPMRSVCLAARNGLTGEIPYKAPKRPRRIEERTVLLIRSGDLVVIRKRPEKGLLASMYEFPGLEGKRSPEEARAAAEAMLAAGGGNACGGNAGSEAAGDGSTDGGDAGSEAAGDGSACGGNAGSGIAGDGSADGGSTGSGRRDCGRTVFGSSGTGAGACEAMPAIRSIVPAPDAVHIFSHVEWHMTGYVLEADSVPEGILAVPRRELSDKYALPSAFDRYIKLINGES